MRPITIYTRLPAGRTCYPICTFPASSECLIGISDAFSAFCLRVSVISSCPRAHCTPNKRVPTLRYTRRHGPIQVHARRLLPSAVPWISEDRLLGCCHAVSSCLDFRPHTRCIVGRARDRETGRIEMLLFITQG